LLNFQATILVYAYTQDIAMSGLFYCIEWSSRLLLIPFMGRWIDTLGIRYCSICFDTCKIVACFLFLGAVHMIKEHTALAVITGFFCSLISLSNAQTLIVYEKYIVELNKCQKSRLDRHANFISQADQYAMIVGPLIGLFFCKKSVAFIVCTAIGAYLINLYFFVSRRYLVAYKLDTLQAYTAEYETTQEESLWTSVGSLLRQDATLAGILFVVVLGNFFSNMLDGTVESAGVAVIFQDMHKPMEHYAFIMIAGGGVGVVATTIFSKIYSAERETLLLLIVVVLEWVAGLGIFASFHHFTAFVFFYALCIGSKVIRGILTRMYRMRTLPSNCFASVSSLVTVLGQLSLPVVGLLLYGTKQYNLLPQFIVLACSFMVLVSCIILLIKWPKSVGNNIAVSTIRERG
jgi:hypothetical protein